MSALVVSRESRLLPLFTVLSRLPWVFWYGFSTFAYFIAYYLVRHRHKIIDDQIAKVLPDLDEAGRDTVHKQFLRNFCDVFIEVLKSASMREADMIARVKVLNLEVAKQYLDAGQTMMFVTSHLCNWEWLLQGVTLQLGYPVDAAYKPLHDLWAERLMLKVRARFGARLVPAKELLADYLKRRDIVRALAINADQAPVSTDKRYWTRFLGQDTAFYIGAEQIARGMRLPVIYVCMRRLRRGYYEVELKGLWDGKERLEPNQVTERYARACEVDVYKHPSDWLWSYRRWRLQKPLYGAE